MAKRVLTSGGEEALQPLSPLRAAPPRTMRKWSLALGLTALVVISCTLLAWAALPEELPLVWQRLLGLICALVAAIALVVATRERESPEEEMLTRARRGQHADFGKRLREAQKVRTTVKLPVLGETSIRGLATVGVFLLVEGWWLTPLAPVGIRQREIADLSVPLAEEITAVVLVAAQERMAVVQPPIAPLGAITLANQIDDDTANSYHRGLKAIALGRFPQARQLLANAMRWDDATPYEIRLARALNEMYAGRFSDAILWYGNALNEKPNDPMLLCQAAVAQLQLCQYDRAEALIDRALKVCRQSPAGRQDPALAVCLHLRAVLKVGRGRDFDQAMQTCLQSRVILDQAPDRQGLLEAASLSNHATLYLLQAKYQAGGELFRQATDLWVRSLSEDHPLAASGLVNLAMLHCNLGRYVQGPAGEEVADQADELSGQALDSHRYSLPETHPVLGISCNARAVVLAAAARYEEAQPLAEEALAIFQQALESEHGNVAVALDTLATIHAGQARYTKAELDYLRAVEVAKGAWGPQHPYPAEILNHLAALYVRQGRFEDAQTLCTEALDVLGETLGEKHPAAAAVLETRGRLEIARGKPRDARPFLEEAITIREESLDREHPHLAEHPQLARTIADLAVLDALSPLNYARGVKRYLRAIEMMDRRLGLLHPDTARLLCGLAALHVRQQTHSEAEACLQRALEIQQQSLVPFHPDLAATLKAYAALVRKIDPGDPQRAAQMQARAESILAAHAEEDRPESGKTQD